MDLHETTDVELCVTSEQDSPKTWILQYLKKVVRDVASVLDLDENVSFDNYDIDSHSILGITRVLEESFGDISITLFFEYETLGELAEYFVERFPETLQNLISRAQSEEGRACLGQDGLEGHGSAHSPEDYSLENALSCEIEIKGNANEAGRDNPLDSLSSNFGKIAIIGISGKFPKSDNIGDFWGILLGGLNCITEIPECRWDHAEVIKKNNGAISSKWGGFVNDVDKFDPLHFGISPREAMFMSPQERLVLQSVWECIEDAGYTPDGLVAKGSALGSARDVGVFVGVMYDEYQLLSVEHIERDGWNPVSCNPASIANRVSFFFDFKGPSIVVDTMCSSSLTSVHLACESLAQGVTDLAVAGGVNVTIHPNKYVMLSQKGFLSSRGMCESFGHDGDGYVPSEGVGTILLKRLDDAIADGDRIYGTIIGSAINHGGKTKGFTVPSPRSQRDVVKRAIARAGIDPRRINYVEAHGTGTQLGDPIEIKGLVDAFDVNEKQYCAIGSVKSNIGHCESAAGVAGIIKVLLQMKYGVLVPSLHAEKINKNIRFENTPFYVQQVRSKWQRTLFEGQCLPYVAGVSSFGAGGANAHLIIEEYVSPSDNEETTYAALSGVECLFPVSARTENQLMQSVSNLKTHLSSEQFLMHEGAVGASSSKASVAYTLQTGRVAMKHKVLFVAGDIAGLVALLDIYLDGKDDVGILGDVAKESLSAELVRRAGNELAIAWLTGENVDWNLLYPQGKPPRVSLPTYPFAKERYWFSDSLDPTLPTSQAGRSAVEEHPLVQRNVSGFSGLRFSSTFTGHEFFFADHQVLSECLLPGAAMLEMGRAALSRATEQPVVELQRVSWTYPLKKASSALTVNVKVWTDPAAGCDGFEIYTESALGWQVHSTGWSRENEGETVQASIDVTGLRQRAIDSVDAATFYQRMSTYGLQYGAGFQTISQAWMLPDGCLAALSLPAGQRQTAADYYLHPSMVDGALQAVMLLWSQGQDKLALPCFVEAIRLYHPTPQRGYAYIRPREQRPKQASYDIEILDEKGVVCLSLSGFTVRQAEMRPTHEILYATAVWQNQALIGAEGFPQETRYHVLLGDGWINRQDWFGMLPCEVRTLSDSAEEVAEKAQRILQDVLLQIQSCVREKPKVTQRFVIVAPQQAEAAIIYAPVAGLLKTAQLENPHIIGSILWLPLDTQKSIAVDCVLHEAQRGRDVEVRYSGPVREVVRYLEVEPPTSPPAVELIQPGGIYWITGGMGGIGQILVWQMVQVPGVRVVVSGRSALNSEQQALLKQWGGQVAYHPGDMNDYATVKRLYDEIKQTYGRIDGILHCAGITRDAFIVNKSMTEWMDVVAPKIKATTYLDEVTQTEPLHFFILFSSLSAIFGNIGQADYAAGNAYLDAYAAYRQQRVQQGVRQGKTLSVNWPWWQEGGMQLDAQSQELLYRQIGVRALTSQDGWHVLAHGYGLSVPQLLVMPGNVSKLKEQLLLAAGRQKQKVMRQPDVAAISMAELPIAFSTRLVLAERVESIIRQQISSVLKIRESELSRNDELSAYGFDSITLTELSNRLSEIFDLHLMPTLFFEHTQIGKLSEYLLANHEVHLKNRYAVAPEAAAKGRAMASGIAAVKRTASKVSQPIQWPVEPVAEIEPVTEDAIAIVGMSCHFPEAANITEFWKNLVNERDCIRVKPENRWDDTGLDAEAVRWGGFIEGIDEFDPAFFGISPREAAWMDPQHRLVLQAVWGALEDGGIQPRTLSGSRTGLFVGVATTDYHDLLNQHHVPVDGHTATGHAHSILVNRISYLLNLRGPSEPVDTACSSSLVALHRAMQSLRSGDCDLAIVGGVNALLSPTLFCMFEKAGMLSSDGRCKTFSAQANGYVRGEGVGVVILKSLKRALADGNQVHALIKSSSINHGGSATSLTAPNPKAQAELLVEAYQKAAIDPKTVGYIEAHGTGTALGDPIEINGLKQAFEQLYSAWGYSDVSQPHCGLGSVKTNIGHLEAGAGMAGLIKNILALKHHCLPGTLHAQQLNPYIQLDGSPFYVVQKTQPWQAPLDQSGRTVARRAGVSSFGFGGVNAHVVLEEFSRPAGVAPPLPQAQVVVLSAKTEDRLKAYARAMAIYLKEEQAASLALEDLAYTLQVGREAMQERVAFVVASVSELLTSLQAFQLGQEDANRYRGKATQLSLGQLLEGMEGQQFLQQILHNGQLHKLAQLWVNGVEFRWEALEEGGGPMPRRRVSLPTYPFEPRHCWFRQHGTAPTAARDVSTITPVRSTESSSGILLAANTGHTRLEAAAEVPAVKVTLSALPAHQPLPGRDGRTGPVSADPLYLSLKTLLADALHLGVAEIEDGKTFADLGVDSILGVELIKTINSRFGLQLQAAQLFDYPSLPQLAEYLISLRAGTKISISSPEQPVHIVPKISLGASSLQPTVAKVPGTDGSFYLPLKAVLADALHVSVDEIDDSKTFADLGVDSILGVELIKTINSRFGFQLQAAQLFDYPSLLQLEGYITSLRETNAVAPLPSDNPILATEVAIPVAQKQTEELAKPLQSDVTPAEEDIAIVGISCQLPGVANKDALWELLKTGSSAIREVPLERWTIDECTAGGSKPIPQWGGFLAHPEYFDPLFFHISPQEAEAMDPQQRLFLQEAWKAIEDAGYAPRQLSATKCGVFAGVMNNDYALLARSATPTNVYEMTGNSNAILSSRIAYFLNLKGPSITIDTACSSSLVALHLACNSLRQGEVDMALAGGVTLYLAPQSYVLMGSAGMLAADGKCKTFDKSADGFVPGEGIAIVVLKRLSDAILAGDHIYGVVKGSGINQDGKTSGITAPSAIAQSELQLSVYQRFNLNPAKFSYVEAHGTGTKLGDPIEINGLKSTFQRYTDNKQYCAIGSLKTNIGHTSGAAGLASLIKVLLCLEHQTLVPTLNFEEINEHIDVSNSPFYINTKLMPWPVETGERRMAAVSAFGFSGTNAHAVVEEFPAGSTPLNDNATEYLFILSGRDQKRLNDYIDLWIEYLARPAQTSPSMAQIACTMQFGRDSMDCRLAVVASDRDDLLRKLKSVGSVSAKDAAVQMGDVRSAQPIYQGMLSGSAGKAFVNGIVEEKDWRKLASLWVNGLAIDWNLLYPQGKPSRVSLPTYPFAKERYWGRSDRQMAVKMNDREAHAFVSSVACSLTKATIAARIRSDDKVFSDHVVVGKKVLSGSAQIELIIEAISQLRNCTGIRAIRDITWDRMVDISESEDLTIDVTTSGECESSTEFYLRHGKNDLLCTKGIVVFSEHANHDTERADLQSILSRCTTKVSKDDCYRWFGDIGIRYGRTHRLVEEILVGDGECIARIETSGLKESRRFALNPCVMDASIQSLIGLNMSLQNGKKMLHVPSRVGKLDIHFPLSDVVYVHSKVSRDSVAGSSQVYDLVIMDQSGKVLVVIESLVLKAAAHTSVEKGDKNGFQVGPEGAGENYIREKLRRMSDEKMLNLLQSLNIDFSEKVVSLSDARART